MEQIKKNKMAHVVKISKQGFNVMDANKKRSKKLNNKGPLPHLLYAIALAYLLGAKKQVKRYQAVAVTLKRRPVQGVYDCLHETSTLFEDLCTVGKYIEKCGEKHKLHQLWFDARNHIRHDIREEFDSETNSRKSRRAKRLKLNHKLQTNISFTPSSIKIGGIVIKIDQITVYLDWADKIISDVLNEAKKKGYIKS